MFIPFSNLDIAVIFLKVITIALGACTIPTLYFFIFGNITLRKFFKYLQYYGYPFFYIAIFLVFKWYLFFTFIIIITFLLKVLEKFNNKDLLKAELEGVTNFNYAIASRQREAFKIIPNENKDKYIQKIKNNPIQKINFKIIVGISVTVILIILGIMSLLECYYIL